MSHLSDIPPAQPDAAFSLIASFKADTAEHKVNLCPGFYRDDKAEPWILPSVAQAKEQIHADPSLNHEHLPLTGHPELLLGSQKLVFGKTRDLKRVASIQTVSGTGANHMAALFLATHLKPKRVWISNPSWINHTEIWRLVGPDVEQRFYPYYDTVHHRVDIEAMTRTLRKEACEGDVIILHACAHNPTGADLTRQQWETVAEICKESGLFAVFDMAYQGFASGDLDQDASAITHFFDRSDLEFAVAQSFSKNFGLYGERVGVLHMVVLETDTVAKVTPLLTQLSRAEITSCPSYGARIVAKILSSPILLDQWQQDLVTMSERMKSMRKALYQGLQRRSVRGSWEHLLTDIGMFSMTGLTRDQVDELRTNHHIYLLPSGRLSVTGLTSNNTDVVAEGFLAVLEGISSWGDIIANAAKVKQIRGFIIDGMSRDIDGSRDIGYPVFGRGVTMISARNRLVQISSGVQVEIRGVEVDENDYVIADNCGAVFIPADRIEEVLELGERIDLRQNGMVQEVRSGRSVAEIMHDKQFEAIGHSATPNRPHKPQNPKEATPDDQELVRLFANSDTPGVSDALDKLGIPGQAVDIMPLTNYNKTTVGPAFTVRYAPASNPPGSVGDFIDDVAVGDVVVIDNGGRTDCTVWGDIMTHDNYPIFSSGRWMRTGKDRVQVECVNESIGVGKVRVSPRDIVVADANGVVIVPRDRAREVAAIASRIEESEQGIREMIRKGSTIAEAREKLGYHTLQRKE
ncbi:Aspartate aminotransferase [Fusarium oxysporum f. sp. raphani]|uniref:Aspartate aminotransferase n=1 Tax=Fusarium oxysporum f. sp. raphani TaxID=96318 RepID=A0A8J5U5A1_FUSOX|nr:Aspartate aminotransferase [Fusarium oxysporum f. sp. raphani]